eukprot:4896-Heterococcus_DN1.PRE.1
MCTGNRHSAVHSEALLSVISTAAAHSDQSAYNSATAGATGKLDDAAARRGCTAEFSCTYSCGATVFARP